jgi:hypothetical protein
MIIGLGTGYKDSKETKVMVKFLCVDHDPEERGDGSAIAKLKTVRPHNAYPS